MGAMFMTGFFMLSGFAISYVYSDESLITIDNLKKFYLRRAINIFPVYWLYISYRTFVFEDALVNKIMTLPIEALGLQSIWHGLSLYGHNDGTWFISCILFCYALFPFAKEILWQISFRSKIIVFIVFSIISVYTPFLCKVTRFDFIYSIYSDCIFRFLEFSLGCILFSVMTDNRFKKCDLLNTWYAFLIELGILIAGVSIGVMLGIGTEDYILYSVIGIPLFTSMLFTLSGVEVNNSIVRHIIIYFRNISYEFYLMQYFAFLLAPKILDALNIYSNMNRIIVSILLCIFISTAVYYLFEKPVTKKLRKMFRC